MQVKVLSYVELAALTGTTQAVRTALAAHDKMLSECGLDPKNMNLAVNWTTGEVDDGQPEPNRAERRKREKASATDSTKSGPHARARGDVEDNSQEHE